MPDNRYQPTRDAMLRLFDHLSECLHCRAGVVDLDEMDLGDDGYRQSQTSRLSLDLCSTGTKIALGLIHA